MNSKKGGLGEAPAMFIAIVVVVAILIIFVIGSGIVKKIEGAESGLKVYNESKTGLDNVFSYMWVDYSKVLKARALFAQGRSAEDSFGEVKYHDK